jgi:hypothetical protein
MIRTQRSGKVEYAFVDSFGKVTGIELGKSYDDPKAIEEGEAGECVERYDNSCGSSEMYGALYELIEGELYAAIVENLNHAGAPEVTVSFHDDSEEAESAIRNVVTPGWDGRC